MHRKLFLMPSFIFVATILISSYLFAAYEDSNTGLDAFNVKLLGYWVSYEDSGENYTELINYTDDVANAPTVDIAVGDAGAQIGTFLSGAIIPAGTIKRIKVRIGKTRIKGWVKSGTHYYVTDASVADLQTRDFGTSQPSVSNCTEIEINGPGNAAYGDSTQTVTIEVAESGTVNISIKFTLGTALTAESAPGGYVIRPSNSFMPEISQI